MSNIGADARSARSEGEADLLEIYGRTGAAADFERVVLRYAAVVYGECRRVTRDAHDAEDAAQLAFLALAIELKSGTTIKRPAAWLQRVARRQALKIVRSRGRRKKREDAARKSETAVLDQTAATEASRDAAAVWIRDAIDALPEKHRLPLVLHYFGGMSLDAIGREMGLTKTAVGTRLHRSRKLLGERLGERGVSFDAGELGAMIALLVPAAVISHLSHAIHAAATPTASNAMLAASVTQMIAAAATRPIAAAAAVLCLGATGAAWFTPANTWAKLRHSFEVGAWLEDVFDWRPELQFNVAPLSLRMDDPTRRGVDQAAMENAPASFALSRVVMPQAVEWTPISISSAAGEGIATASTPAVAIRLGRGEDPARSPLPAVSRPPLALAASVPIDRKLKQWPASFAAAQPDAPARSQRESEQTVIAGEHRVFETLTLGLDTNDVDFFHQTGGEVDADEVIVGDRGEGNYDLGGGKLITGGVKIADKPRSHGTVHVGDGEVVVNKPRPVTIGVQGWGQLFLGTRWMPGTVTSIGSLNVQFIVRETASAQGLVQGWGDVQTSGALVNNGRVIADGFDHLRALNLSQSSHVLNDIENPVDGTNGWYARRGGRVELPAFQVSPGTHTYTWGESDNDPTLDLVNSVRLVAHDQPKPTKLAMSLRTIALSDPLDVPMPSGLAVFGLWQLSAVDFDPTKLDIEVRYDHTAANGLFPGEFATRLVGFQNGVWKLASQTKLDAQNHIVSGSFDGSVDYLAVGMSWGSPLYQFVNLTYEPLGYRRIVFDYSTAYAAAAPEPTMLIALVACGAFASRRRRRLRCA